jgi:hypothetical protein
MQPLKAAMRDAQTTEMGVIEGMSTALERYRQWAEALNERVGTAPTFQHVTRTRLIAALRTYYPEGTLRENLLDALLLAVVRQALDMGPDTFLLDEGPSGLEEAPMPEVNDERARVLKEVIQQVGAGLVSAYAAAVRDHLLSPLGQVDEGAALLSRIAPVVERWASELDQVLLPAVSSAPVDVLTALSEAHEQLLESLTLNDLLSEQEGQQLGEVLRNNIPYWLRLASQEDKTQLEQLAQRVQELDEALIRTKEGLDSFERFVALEVAEHIEHTHGVFVEPAQVLVTTAYTHAGSERTVIEPLHDVLIKGPYPAADTVRRWVSQAPEDIDVGTVDWHYLFEHFDVRARYFNALTEFYQAADTRALLFDAMDAALLHSAFAARMRGHLSQASHDMVVRAQAMTAPTQVTLLVVPQVGPLSLLLFQHPDEHAVRPFVLYAPEKYDGQEWVELPSLRAVTQEIGGWVQDERGRLYLLEQLPRQNRGKAERYLEEVFLKPVQWQANQDLRTAPGDYQAALNRMVVQYEANELETVEWAYAPRWYTQQPLAVRHRVNALNEQLNVQQRHLEQAGLNPEPFVAFAKRTVAEAITPYLSECGVTEPVDPDTIVFEFKKGAVFEFSSSTNPDKQTATLMDLAVTGYDDNAGLDNPNMPVRSSIGQDLSKVRAAELAIYIRSAYLGDKYTRLVKAEYVGTSGQWRRELFGRFAALKLSRDALVSHLKGQLSDGQYAAIQAAIDDASLPGASTAAWLFKATVRGQSISQVYLVRLPGEPSEQALLYTPQAPDGLAFRPYASAMGEGLSVEMQLYLLERARLVAQESVRQRLADISLGKASADAPATGVAVTSLGDEYTALVEHMLADVDRITTSRREVITEQVLKGVGFAAVPLGVIFPPLGFTLDLAFLAVDVVRGYQAYRQGDTAAAVAFFANAYVSGLCLLLPVGYHHFKAARSSRTLARRSSGVYHGARSPRPVNSRHGLRKAVDCLDIRQALPTLPEGLEQVAEEGLTAGLYRLPDEGLELQNRYCIRQSGRYFEVSLDDQAGTLRLVDARNPSAHYKMPIHRTAEGHWAFNPFVGLRGGKASLYVGALDDLNELLPPAARLKPERAALAGEGVIAGYNPAQAENYLLGVEVQGSVVTTLFNPATGKGAVLNIDHGIATPVKESLDHAVTALGPIDPAKPIQAATVGGDWLTMPGDVLQQVNRALGLQGVLTQPEHWLPGNGLGGVTGVLLDLKTGGSLVWRFTSHGRRAFYDPLRQYPAFGDANLRARVQRFWQRLKDGRWQETGQGKYGNRVMEVEAEAGKDSVAIVLHELAG